MMKNFEIQPIARLYQFGRRETLTFKWDSYLAYLENLNNANKQAALKKAITFAGITVEIVAHHITYYVSTGID